MSGHIKHGSNENQTKYCITKDGWCNLCTPNVGITKNEYFNKLIQLSIRGLSLLKTKKIIL